jgi:RecB family exonuclease
VIVYEESWTQSHCEEPGLTWAELLEEVGLGVPESYDLSKTFFEAALAESGVPLDFFSTLSQLRESPVRDETDLEFCFSHLPKTEKNTFLKKLALLYLKSPLAQTDRMARTSALADRPLLLQHPVLTAPELTLVRGRQSSPLFQELYKTLAQLRGDRLTRVVESWETSDASSSVQKRGLFLRHSTATVLLDRLVDKIGAEARRHRKVRVFFEGTSASRAYLISRAASAGFRLTESAPRQKPGGFDSIRQSTLPLPERLRLSRLYLETRHSFSSFHEWVEGQSLAEDYKRSLLHGPFFEERRLPATDGLVLLPFHPLPPRKGTKDLFFLEPVPEPLGTLAFDPSERFRLFAQGFLLQEADPKKTRNSERVGALHRVQGGRPIVFLTLDFPLVQIGRLIRSEPTVQKAENSECTPLPAPVILSATALETFADCPSKFFYGQALRLRKSIPEEKAFAVFFGKLVHRTLEWAFQENPWEAVDEALLTATFDRALLEASPHSRPWFRVSLRQRFLPLAAGVAQIERKLREALGPLTPFRFEQSFELELAGAVFRGRIDRVDRDANGAVVVLDYKTGSVDFSPEHVRKGTHFQALIYLLSQQARVAGVLFYDLKAGEVRRGLVRDRDGIKKFFTRGHSLSEEGWDALVDSGKKHIDSLVSRIRAGDFKATPSPAACEYCDMGLFCHRRNGVTG